MVKTAVHTGDGGPVKGQAVLIITQFGDSMQITTYGDGECREVIDGILETMRNMMKEDPDFVFPE